MSVRVKVASVLRRHTGGASIVEAEGSTLGEVLEDLESRFPGLTRRLYGEDGGLSRHVNVYVGEEDARLRGGLAAEVPDGETVSLIPAVAGGTVRAPWPWATPPPARTPVGARE